MDKNVLNYKSGEYDSHLIVDITWTKLFWSSFFFLLLLGDLYSVCVCVLLISFHKFLYMFFSIAWLGAQMITISNGNELLSHVDGAVHAFISFLILINATKLCIDLCRRSWIKSHVSQCELGSLDCSPAGFALLF